MFKISATTFWTIDKIFQNHHFNLTDCNYTLTTTLLQHLKPNLPKKTFLLLHIKYSTRNQFHWLTNYSHYLTNPRPMYYLNQPLRYKALLTHYSHIRNTHKTLRTCLVLRRPNARSHSVLLIYSSSSLQVVRLLSLAEKYPVFLDVVCSSFLSCSRTFRFWDMPLMSSHSANVFHVKCFSVKCMNMCAC